MVLMSGGGGGGVGKKRGRNSKKHIENVEI